MEDSNSDQRTLNEKSEEIKQSEDELSKQSQSSFGQRTAVEKSIGKISEETEPSEEPLSKQPNSDQGIWSRWFGFGQRTADEKSNGKEEIEPLEKNSSQSDSGQRTFDEKSNGKVSNLSFKNVHTTIIDKIIIFLL